MDDDNSATAASNDGTQAEYQLMLELEDLESTLEELEESAAGSSLEGAPLPDDIRALLAPTGINTVSELRVRIAQLHQILDRDADS